ncbi:MAG: hypothetical protein ACYC90_13305 [Candidatus Nanopelagicales bacterium]
MSKGPWWYSGDEVTAEPPAEPTPAGPAAAVTGDPASDRPGGPIDWTALAVGAARLVEWATERVVAPHAEHDDPQEHPDCVVCRALALMADRPATASTTGTSTPPDDIAWIPILGEVPAPEA